MHLHFIVVQATAERTAVVCSDAGCVFVFCPRTCIRVGGDQPMNLASLLSATANSEVAAHLCIGLSGQRLPRTGYLYFALLQSMVVESPNS